MVSVFIRLLFYIQTYKKEVKHFNYLRCWLLKKCIQIEKKKEILKI